MDKQDSADRGDHVTETPPPADAATGTPMEPEPAPANPLVRYGSGLLFVAALCYLMFGVLGWSPVAVLLLVLGLGLVIFIHELGHFLVAKWCDVHVETFSIGFGPALPGCRWQKGETTYMIAWLPLGGYVKMVGEGDMEDDEDDPRSFKRKTVGQRMAIISAGVVMNVILGCICFIIAYMHGVDEEPGIVGVVQAGGPAFEAGVRPGQVIEKIGRKDKPTFEDVKRSVILSSSGEAVNVDVKFPGEAKVQHLQIVPDRDPNDERNTMPKIGIATPFSLTLVSERIGARLRPGPVTLGSAAAEASPAFTFDDSIIATTDPDDPSKVTPLPIDPRDPEREKLDYFVFRQRMQRLAGKEVTITVRRADGQEVDIRVPPAFTRDLGLRMKIGPVTSVAEHQRRDDGIKKDDRIEHVEVRNRDGSRTRWVAAGKPAPAGVQELPLDPLRLPDELKKWAAERAPEGDKTVTVRVTRNIQRDAPRGEKIIELPWDDDLRYDVVLPLDLWSPLPIPELGIAYKVDTTVEQVAPGSPAAKAGLKAKDVIKSVRLYEYDVSSKAIKPMKEWVDLKSDQWANVFIDLQYADSKQIDLRVERDEDLLEETFTLTAEPDKSWPRAERGFHLIPDRRLLQAQNVVEAVELGMLKTGRLIMDVYMQLKSLFTGRISYKNIGGPIQIARMGYHVASHEPFRLILFLGLININLAVINFLPIPVLDGGHMVFLIYEKLRGRPASEQVRVVATTVGLALIVLLLVVVTIWDVIRIF